MRCRLLFFFASIFLAGVCGGSTSTAANPASAVIVPAGDILASTNDGYLVVLDRAGKLIRRLFPVTSAVQGISIAPDRAHAYVSFYGSESGALPSPPALYKVDLATGAKTKIGNGISPALSPDGTRLAYLTTAMQGEITWLRAMSVIDLTNGTTRQIPFTSD